jgi:hypothetical protein
MGMGPGKAGTKRRHHHRVRDAFSDRFLPEMFVQPPRLPQLRKCGAEEKHNYSKMKLLETIANMYRGTTVQHFKKKGLLLQTVERVILIVPVGAFIRRFTGWEGAAKS